MWALRRRSIDVLGKRVHVTESLSKVARGGQGVFVPPKNHQRREVSIPA
ncbi:MAG: hypothetical protein ACJ74O_15970 [Frankiaceae bacterium]